MCLLEMFLRRSRTHRQCCTPRRTHLVPLVAMLPWPLGQNAVSPPRERLRAWTGHLGKDRSIPRCHGILRSRKATPCHCQRNCTILCLSRGLVCHSYRQEERRTEAFYRSILSASSREPYLRAYTRRLVCLSSGPSLLRCMYSRRCLFPGILHPSSLG